MRVIVFLLCMLPLLAHAAGTVEEYPQVKTFFPMADRFGDFEGDPPAATVFRQEEVVGYVFRTNDIAPIPAYSGKPVNVLVGFDMEGRITGAYVLEHHEPILLVGIPERKLFDFVDQYEGKNLADRIKVGAGADPNYVNIDAITGATVTVMVINRAIMRAARKLAVSRNLLAAAAEEKRLPAQVRMDVFEETDWKFLTGNGAIRRMLLTYAEVEKAFKGTAGEGVGGKVCSPDELCETFIDLYYGYLNVPTIGRNLLGESQYNSLMNDLKPGEHAIALVANGDYSFKGSGYVRGGIFDRIQVMQGSQNIIFRDMDYIRLADVYLPGLPEFREMGIFIVRDGYEFDPGSAWQLELLVRREVGPLDSVFTTFTTEYETPETYIERPAPAPAPALEEEEEIPLWQVVWDERKVEIWILVTALGVLMAILIFQDVIVRKPVALTYIRNSYLLFTLLFIGWYALGQLSVVNVFTFVSALFQDFRWDTFLLDPVIFILWAFVAATLLLWGRGVFCGWLCPFGALQKLTNEIALKLKIRQRILPTIIHERLWALKYIILLALFGISLQSLATAERFAEVEPFKTAITLHFDREWPFVLYALALVAISTFNSKFYCKYLCPLGAALAIPARLRLFDWLRRRKECGKPCQVCANECEIQAIHHTGEINANECHYCLDCQVTYWNDRKCPPLINRRKRHEKAMREQALEINDNYLRDARREFKHNKARQEET